MPAGSRGLSPAPVLPSLVAAVVLALPAPPLSVGDPLFDVAPLAVVPEPPPAPAEVRALAERVPPISLVHPVQHPSASATAASVMFK